MTEPKWVLVLTPATHGACLGCGRVTEGRMNFCFDCAHTGEKRAAKRTVLQHLRKCLSNFRRRRWWQARYDLTWAIQRLTRTGDYSKDGYFDSEGHDWRHHD